MVKCGFNLSPLMNLPLSEKYRPQILNEILGNEEVILALNNLAKMGIIPHMLFYGPPGTGKTTTIRALASLVYGNFYKSSVLELNASDERGIDTVRNTIKSFAQTLSFQKKKKLIILDEADSMSRDAQNCMRRIIEDFSGNVRFCLIANYSSKIIPAIQSRCTKFRFSPVNDLKIKNMIEDVCRKEKIEYDKFGVDALIKTSDGDMRKLMNDIEGVSNSFGNINEKNVHLIGGIVENSIFEDFFETLCTKKFNEILLNAKVLKDNFSIGCENLIIYLSEVLIKSDLKNKMIILKLLADLQYRLSLGCSEDIQLNAFISIFILYR